MRLIDADALVDDLRKDKEYVYSHIFCHVGCDAEESLLVDLEQMVNNQPTIEAMEVVHGEWIEERWYYICSQCKKEFTEELPYINNSEYGMPKFCPECGAKMKGGAE